jgi:hypothetical protein
LSQKICYKEKLIFKEGIQEKASKCNGAAKKKSNHLNLHGPEGLSPRMLNRNMKDSEIHHSMQAATRQNRKIDIQVDVSKPRNS